MLCQAAWTEVQSTSLSLENPAKCQILWQNKPFMSQSGTPEQLDHLMLCSVPQFTLTHKLQTVISLSHKLTYTLQK